MGHEWTFTDEHGVQRHQKGAGLGGEHNVGKVRLDKQRALSYVARFKLPTRIAPRLDPRTRRLARWKEATAHASPRRTPPQPGPGQARATSRGGSSCRSRRRATLRGQPSQQPSRRDPPRGPTRPRSPSQIPLNRIARALAGGRCAVLRARQSNGLVGRRRARAAHPAAHLPQHGATAKRSRVAAGGGAPARSKRTCWLGSPQLGLRRRLFQPQPDGELRVNRVAGFFSLADS